MIPTYTYAIKEKLLVDYLGSNLIIALISNINLGITDTPNAAQLEARRNYATSNLINEEIGNVSLKGYKRHLIPNNTIVTQVISSNQTETTLNASFTAFGDNFDPFTHIVVLRGANITGASTSNGNNRGDIVGTIIFIEPVNNVLAPFTPYTLLEGSTFNYTFKLVNATQVI